MHAILVFIDSPLRRLEDAESVSSGVVMFAAMPIALGYSKDGCEDDSEDPASEYNSDCAIMGLKMRFGMRQSRADKYSLRPGLMLFQDQAHCKPLIVSTKLRVFKNIDF